MGQPWDIIPPDEPPPEPPSKGTGIGGTLLMLFIGYLMIGGGNRTYNNTRNNTPDNIPTNKNGESLEEIYGAEQGRTSIIPQPVNPEHKSIIPQPVNPDRNTWKNRTQYSQGQQEDSSRDLPSALKEGKRPVLRELPVEDDPSKDLPSALEGNSRNWQEREVRSKNKAQSGYRE